MKLSKLFGVSAIITGAFAITGKPSSISGNLSSTSHTGSVTTSSLTVESVVPDVPVTAFDAVHVALGVGEHCGLTTFDREHYIHLDQCYGQDQPFTTIRSRFVQSPWSATSAGRCVLVTFSDANCTTDGAIISQYSYALTSDEEKVFEKNPFRLPSRLLDQPDCSELWTQRNGHRIQGHSVKWVCEDDIEETWADPFPAYPHSDDDDDDDLTVSARSIDSEGGHDRVTVTPADGFNCNTAQSRDTDTKHQGHCHSFDHGFFSLSASVKRASKYSVFGGSQPCEVLVFSDNKCRRDGASVVDLLNTTSLGVCHNVSLHHGKDVAAIAGHSWKWICGRQNIDDCLKPAHHSKAHHSAALSTVIDRPTKTVTATTSLACSITTDHAHYFDVVTSLITLKPVTHVSTSVFTKTKTHLHTKLITSVTTDVSTVLHSVTKPYKTTYMVCDVHATPQA